MSFSGFSNGAFRENVTLKADRETGWPESVTSIRTAS